jgi:hypothetical protein
MRKSLILILIALASCTPFKWVDKPVKMNYAVNVYTEQWMLMGYVLCEKYEVKNDTLYLLNAGYYKRLRNQRSVCTMLMPSYWKYTIVDL